jgi:hypothetical protein
VDLPVECTVSEHVAVPTLVIGSQCVFGDCDGFARSKTMY